MTEVIKGAGVALGLVAVPAVVTTKLVFKALQGPDYFDPAIPAPCWVAVQLPDRKAIVKAGAKATLEVGVTNLGDESEAYEVETNTPAVAISQATFTLKPLERRVVELELQIPASAHGALTPVVVTVSGCKTYRFRWLLKAKKFHMHVHPHGHVGHHGHAAHHTHLHAHAHAHHHHPLTHHHAAAALGCGCCHAADIHDKPDYQHHWYDHFYTECGCDHD